MDEQSGLTFNHLGEERTRSLGAGTLTIGRHEDNDIVLDNPYISRYHAEIISEGPRHLIRDLGSTSGTFANGERITQRRLKDGDCVRLGQGRGVEFRFHSSDSNGGSGHGGDLKPIRIIAPDETLFINAGKLPHSGDLADETIERLRALYEFTSELLIAQSAEDLSRKLAAFMHRTVKANRCAVLLWNPQGRALEVTSECGATEIGAPSRGITDLAYNDNVAVLSMDASTDARFSEGE